MLARHGGEGGRKYGLKQRIEKEEGGPLACRLLLWENGDDVYSAFQNELRDFLPPSTASVDRVVGGEHV